MGYLLAILAVCCYGSLAVLAKKAGTGIPPLHFIAFTMALLSGGALILARVFESSYKISSVLSANGLLVFVFALINLVGFFLYLKAIQVIPVGHYQFLYGISPLVAAIAAYFFLSEPLYWRYIPALGLILAGLYIAILAK